MIPDRTAETPLITWNQIGSCGEQTSVSMGKNYVIVVMERMHDEEDLHNKREYRMRLQA